MVAVVGMGMIKRGFGGLEESCRFKCVRARAGLIIIISITSIDA